MFVVYPTNIDYLIESVRLRTGDYNSEVFSDSLVRGALISAVLQLQRIWSSRYLVYRDTMLVSPQPSDVASGYVYALVPGGYAVIGSGYIENDIFRNPYVTFSDQTTSVIAQGDEDVIVVLASIILLRARLGSSAASFVNWSDGEYSYSNVSSSATMRAMINDLVAEYTALIKSKRATPVRGEFTNYIL